jgi:hypothetical protein
MSFEIGDRVAVYDVGWCLAIRRCGEVVGYSDEPSIGLLLSVKLDEESRSSLFHPKQCRKLIKKKRRSVWVHTSSLESGYKSMIAYMTETTDYIEFREVKKK